jgi:hypothetical protein
VGCENLKGRDIFRVLGFGGKAVLKRILKNRM